MGIGEGRAVLADSNQLLIEVLSDDGGGCDAVQIDAFRVA